MYLVGLKPTTAGVVEVRNTYYYAKMANHQINKGLIALLLPAIPEFIDKSNKINVATGGTYISLKTFKLDNI